MGWGGGHLGNNVVDVLGTLRLVKIRLLYLMDRQVKEKKIISYSYIEMAWMIQYMHIKISYETFKLWIGTQELSEGPGVPI